MELTGMNGFRHGTFGNTKVHFRHTKGASKITKEICFSAQRDKVEPAYFTPIVEKRGRNYLIPRRTASA